MRVLIPGPGSGGETSTLSNFDWKIVRLLPLLICGILLIFGMLQNSVFLIRC